MAPARLSTAVVERLGVVWRVVAFVAPLVAVGATWLAAGRAVPYAAIAVAVLSALAARRPDSHLGLAVVAVVGVHWLTTVDDVTSPWAMVTAGALVAFHTAAAAAALAPVDAEWTPTMARRWTRRGAALLGVGAATWVVATLLDGWRARGSGLVLVAALAGLTAGALWVRRLTLPGPVRR